MIGDNAEKVQCAVEYDIIGAKFMHTHGDETRARDGMVICVRLTAECVNVAIVANQISRA